MNECLNIKFPSQYNIILSFIILRIWSKDSIIAFKFRLTQQMLTTLCSIIDIEDYKITDKVGIEQVRTCSFMRLKFSN